MPLDESPRNTFGALSTLELLRKIAISSAKATHHRNCKPSTAVASACEGLNNSRCIYSKRGSIGKSLAIGVP